MRWVICILAVAVMAFAVSGLGAAAGTRDCSGVGGVSAESTAGSAVVRPVAKRLHFVLGGGERAACPDESHACRGASYVTPGDFAIVGRTFESFTCALVIGPGGRRTEGWLSTAALEPASPPLLEHWYGFWVVPATCAGSRSSTLTTRWST